jgi:CNT family concentrative nucleoside transporter
MIWERLVGIIGLVVLMGLAFLFSTNKKKISLKTIVWGLGLQLLFALIILSENIWSFVGMFIFLFIIFIFVFKDDWKGIFQNKILSSLVILAVGSSLMAGFYFLDKINVTVFVLAACAIFYVVCLILKKDKLTRFGFTGTALLIVSILWSRGIYGAEVLQFLSDKVAAFLALTDLGVDFVFGAEAAGFAFRVLPTIIFFSSVISILYFVGLVQLVVNSMARFMRWGMGTSGSETLSVSANIFVGQTEAPFLVKPFLKGMTQSELHAVMVGGFATIAGGVLAAFIQFGIPAGHLIAASVMSAPAALVIAKILYPETEHSQTAGDVEMPEVKTAKNVLEAASNGVTDGLYLALNVGAMLIAFIALIGLINVFLGWGDRLVDGIILGNALNETIGEYEGIFPGSLQTLFGWIFSPLAWAMGVPWSDAPIVGNLLGMKVAVNEFVAYGFLSNHIKAGDLSYKAIIISTYALCGFANFSSIGIQIGGIGSLAPERKSDLAKLGFRAMVGGAFASWMTATIAGILIGS